MEYSLEFFAEQFASLEFDAQIIDAPPPPPFMEGQISSSNSGMWIKMTRHGGRPFYNWFVPGEKAPLFVFLPGADGTIWDLPIHDCACIFTSPLGYGQPDGSVLHSRENQWLNTILEKPGENLGEYIMDALCAVKWALNNEPHQSLILCGSSQGGGIALALGGILGEEYISAVLAHQPMFIGFSSVRLEEVLDAVSTSPHILFSRSQVSRRLSFIDPLCFAGRLDMPLLIVSGKEDPFSPPAINKLLYDVLPNQNSRSICIPGRRHGYDPEFFLHAQKFLNDIGISIHFRINKQ